MKFASIAAVLLCFFNAAFGQISFSDSSRALFADSTLSSGVAMGVTDMNSDGLDDLVRLSNASDLVIEYQNLNGGTFSSYSFGNLGTGTEWSLCVADVDTNLHNDLFLGGANNGLKLLRSNAGGTAYTSTALPGPPIFLQGSNFVDIDGDGDLDIFACHDNGISSVYRNNGGGTFTYDLNLINTASTVPSDNSGNYGSTWTDYDNDGDVDLYLSKCSAGVNNPNDGRRLNMMFRNNGNGTFTEVAQAIGLQPLAQSWSSDFADIDNDGDLDCFVVNHDSSNQLYRNNGNGTFTDITASTGIAADLASVVIGIQCIFDDFDNDGYIDLLLTSTGYGHRLYKNNGNSTFTSIPTPFPTNLNIHTAAVGDLNNDGYLDVCAGFAAGYNFPGNDPDRLFINDGGPRGYIKVWLEGVQSNYNGIGARLELYGAWGVQVREVRSGESYGIMNSLIQHFGTGSALTIDSLIVRWPSGVVDRICSPPVAGSLLIKEGAFPNSPLNANFTFSALDSIVSFTDASSGQPFNWFWTFGDGATGNTPGPTHTYPGLGTYQVCLTVNNSCFVDSSCQILNLTCLDPVADFSWSGTDTVIQYANNSSGGSPQTWDWDFGDGNTSTAKNPQHTYSMAGTYTVCLITTNTCGADTLCQTVVVTCPGGPIVAGFQAFISDTTVVFFDTSSGNIGTRFWDFGDGNTSTDLNPRHTYTAAGIYIACLHVQSPCGSDSICDTININCPPPTAAISFSVNDTVVSFMDQSGFTATGWYWDFGDGNSATTQNPVHAYAAPGTYTVCFRLETACGNDSLCDTVTVGCSPPTAAFSSSPLGTTVDFTDQSNSGITSWSWDFGDGNSSTLMSPSHTFGDSGTYVICLTVENVCGTHTTCDTIFLSLSGIHPASVSSLGATLYPNPSNGLYFLEGETQNNQYLNIILSDLEGRKLQEWPSIPVNGTWKIPLQLEHLLEGVYLLELEVENNRQGFFLIKQ